MGVVYTFYVNFDGDNSNKNMQDLAIPGWAVFMIVTFGGGWLWWMIVLTKMANQAINDNQLFRQENHRIQQDINTLNDKMDESKKDFHDSLQKLTGKLDLLFGEFQFMKGLITSQPVKKSG